MGRSPVIPAPWSLTPLQARLLAYLAAAGPECRTWQQIGNHIGGHRDGGITDGCVRVHVFRIRRRMAGVHPHVIETWLGYGYRVAPDALDTVREGLRDVA